MVSGRCMKPLKADQQLRSVSLLYFVCAPALKQKPSPLIRRRAWMQAPIEASHGEEWRVFLLDILSHRVSAMGMFRQSSETMAQPGHLEYQRGSQHAPPQQVGEEPD